MRVFRVRFSWLLLTLLASCGGTGGRSPRSEDTAAPAADSSQPDTLTTVMGESGDGPLVGDTLELISIGGRSLPEGRGVRLPCDPAGTPLLERIVFTGDSTYTQIEVIRPGCRDPLVSGSDTLVIASEYRVHGDTLTLYTGGGDEMFQSYNGRIFRDSVVQIDIREDQVRRYARRHRVGRVAR